MNFLNIIDNTRTDKNTIHSYLPVYSDLLTKKQISATNILEIGICYGGSIKLWHDFFINATIHGLDCININDVWDELKNNNRIKLYTSIDAYDNIFLNTNILNQNIKYDLILDDGPHTLESMIKFIELYLPLLKDDGILIIEDVQSMDWLNILSSVVPENFKQYIKIYDLRLIKSRYDDILFIIDKS